MVSINICFNCGNKVYGNKDNFYCDCGAKTAKISRPMFKLASHFQSLGFKISAAQDYISIPIESENLKVILVHVDFRRIYREEIFSDIPAGWSYLVFPAAEPPFCRIALMEHTSAFSFIPDYTAVKHIITELDLWVRLIESENRDAVYRLAGWI